MGNLAARAAAKAQRHRRCGLKGAVIIVLLLIAFIKADRLTTLAEDGLFVDNIIYAKSSQYQRIVVTKGKTGYALFLNGNLQFNSFDEYRYHEALVHPAFAAHAGDVKRVLVLGGGDGLALREIEKYPSVETIQLVDLDPAMTGISDAVPALGELNEHSFRDPRVHTVNADAFVWLDGQETEPFDVAIVDFPDPNNFALGKLYTTRFYNLLKKKLKPDSSVVIQTTSPLIARRSFLVRDEDARSGGIHRPPVSNDGAELWGMGLRSCKTPAVFGSCAPARGTSTPLSQRRILRLNVRVSGGHDDAGRRDRDQPA